MPAPAAVYVVAVVGGIAVAIALKQFVYDPHIAPRFKAWQDVRSAQRQARRRTREPVSAQVVNNNDTGLRRNTGCTPDTSVELVTLSPNEVDEWRNTVSSSTLRQRHPTGVIDESNPFLPYPPLDPSSSRASTAHIMNSSPSHSSNPSLQLDDSVSSLNVFTPRSPSVPALPLINFPSFPSDVDSTISIYQTPVTQVLPLPSHVPSPQFASPLLDDVLSFRSGLSSPTLSSVASTIDYEEAFSIGSSIRSDDSWAEL